MSMEEDILKRLHEGEEEALKQLFDTYYEMLCLYAEGITRSHMAAEEIVEDIFVYLWLNAKTLRIHSLKNYLFKSTYNNSLKYLQKHRAEMRFTAEWDYSLEDEEILHASSSSFPLANLLREEITEKASSIFRSLPDQCRKIYSLSREENLSYSEIAEKLNISIGTVKTQMSRAFKKFREGLREYLPLLLMLVPILS